MKYSEAQKQLIYALKNQKTISISKLNNLLQSLNISVKKANRDVEVDYFKSEMSKLKNKIKEKERECGNLRSHINTLKELYGIKPSDYISLTDKGREVYYEKE